MWVLLKWPVGYIQWCLQVCELFRIWYISAYILTIFFIRCSYVLKVDKNLVKQIRQKYYILHWEKYFKITYLWVPKVCEPSLSDPLLQQQLQLNVFKNVLISPTHRLRGFLVHSFVQNSFWDVDGFSHVNCTHNISIALRSGLWLWHSKI